MTPSDDRAALIAEIRTAFTGMSREGGLSLHEAVALDDYKLWSGATPEERSPIRSLDVDASWEEVPDQHIERCSSVFSFLDVPGFRYYLPAYMVWAIKYFDTSPSCSSENVVYALSHSILRDRDQEIFDSLNPAQGRAINHFLKFMAANDWAFESFVKEALDGYWGKFE